MVASGGTVILVWALTRELDPDRPVAAGIAGALSGAAVVVTGETSLIALTGLLVATRILTRSTGAWPSLTDLAVVGVAVGIFARTPVAWAAGMALAVAVALDTAMVHPAPAHHMWLGLATGVAVTVTAVVSDALNTGWVAPGPASLAIVLVGLVLGWTAPVGRIHAVGDHRNLPLDESRVVAARRLTVAALAVATLTGGTSAWPGWAAVAGVAALAPWRQR